MAFIFKNTNILENYNFDNIRSFRNDEVNSKLNKLIIDEQFNEVLKKIYDTDTIKSIKKSVENVNDIDFFQTNYISKYANKIIDDTVTKLSASGIENIDQNKAYLFISNHRDIILDSALLNELLNRNNIPKTEIAIGSNLLIYPWISDIVRLNRSFIVRRDLTGKDMLEGSKKLSAYIRNKIKNDNTSVWIAQKEGRTKDGNDKTQVGLLKMFNYSGENSFIENFKELNIIPVSISYEYEPCDSAKTQEIYKKSINEKFVKTHEQDMVSMARGLSDKKGSIHFSFGKISDVNLSEIAEISRTNDKYSRLSEIIDSEIHKNFMLHEINYIAYDIINFDNPLFKDKYSTADKDNFIKFAEKQIENLEGEKNALKEIFYKIYSNPVKNALQYQ